MGWVWVGWTERRDGGGLRRLSIDTVNVLCLGESLGNGVTPLACPAVSLGLTEPVETDLGVALIDLSECATDGSGFWGLAGRGKVLLVDILPVGDAERSSDGFLKLWYRLKCLLLGLYRLVPELNVPVAGWGRGSVIGGASVRGK